MFEIRLFQTLNCEIRLFHNKKYGHMRLYGGNIMRLLCKYI